MSHRSAMAFAYLALSAPAPVVCGHGSTSTDVTGTVETVASTTQICDCITQLASGDAPNDPSLDRIGADGKIQHFGIDAARAKSHLKFTCLLAPDASAHEHNMTMAQSKTLPEADLFFTSGVDLEHSPDSAADPTGFKGTMVVISGAAGVADTDDLVAQKEKEKAKPYKVDWDNAKVEVAKWPFLPEEGESKPEFRFDPYVWASSKNAIVQVTNIGAALGKAVPDQAGVFCSHVDTRIAKLKKLDEQTASSLDSIPQDKQVLFASHSAFGCFGKEFGVKFEGVTLSDLNTQQDTTTDKIQQTASKAKSSGTMAIFAENFNNPKSIQKITEVVGVKAVIGDETPYGDSLGTLGSDGETYVDSTLHNVPNLIKAWGGMATEIPAGLAQWTPRASDVKWGTI